VAQKSYGGAARGAPANAGLNFNLTEVLKNTLPSKAGITFLTETLKDFDSPGPVPASAGQQPDNHVARSHFHSITGALSPSTTWPDVKPAIDDNGFQSFTLSGGTLAFGATATVRVKIHDIVVAGFARKFTLTKTIPEPTTLTMLLTGMVALTGFRLVRKNRGRGLGAGSSAQC
jgi:hypothetical protein